MSFPYLSTIVFLPVIGAILILLLAKRDRAARWMAAVFTFIPLALAIALFVDRKSVV